MTEQESRGVIVAETLSWVGTPRRLGAHIKGVGCDCATLLIEVFIACGLLTRETVASALRDEGLKVYADDWWCHASDEKYMRVIMRFARRILETTCYASLTPAQGCVVLTKAAQSKYWNHGGIVVKWPRIVHAIVPKVIEVDASRDPMWAGKQIAIYDFWSQS